MKPDAAKHRPGDGAYIRKLVERSGLTQEQAAKRVGITGRALRYAIQRGTSYPIQFALEALAHRA